MHFTHVSENIHLTYLPRASILKEDVNFFTYSTHAQAKELSLTNEPISPEKLSNEDLGKALETAREDTITKSEVIINTANDVIQDDLVINDDGEDMNEDESETDTPEVGAQAEPTKEPEKAPPTVEERLALMEKRLKDKDDFIAKQGDEIGKLRKAVPEPKKELHNVTADNFFEDPIANVEKITENQRIRLEQEHELRTQALREEIEKRKGITKQIAPDYEENIDAIAEVLKQDGFNEEGIKQYKQNPFAYDPPLLHNLNLRAKLVKENNALKEEINRLKGNPKKILDKVENISRQKPRISSGVVSSEADGEIDIDSLSDKQISKLSTKQIEDLLRKKTKR